MRLQKLAYTSVRELGHFKATKARQSYLSRITPRLTATRRWRHQYTTSCIYNVIGSIQ
ncbi:hypothetical protein EGR_09941 [Echinococcus granulosus]|uniref:Uncharacterized protein n=1 Tax=Echinococcus granulosus TaxID=6210 RepID=W6U270_ECHGR|nr:hypothetical protein EGR_09941 [Echinococcus granulosus]EUB55200.1 hypothetical protein EGR_09941 [Echinococcus granulosus]